MTAIALVDRATYNGLLLEEASGNLAAPISVDLAIFTSGWESRSKSFVGRKLVTAKNSLILRYADDEIIDDYYDQVDLSSCGNHRRVELPSHFDMQGSVGRLVELVKEQAVADRPRSIFIDLTSMPKVMMQWAILELLRSKVMAELFLGYIPGFYDLDGGAGPFDQGVRKYMSIPHSLGDGGSSVRRGCIAALGADERLISHYFESEAGFDRYHLLASEAELDGKMTEKVERQIFAIQVRYGLDEDSVERSPPYSILRSLRGLERIVRSATHIDSWELFCTGPKPFAAAGCLLSLRHRNVRLIGRIPVEYRRSDVRDAGIASIIRIVDLTNPSVSSLCNLRIPLGTEAYRKF
ncbi:MULTISPECIES: hypothetical protein [unclassified Sphingopyxis]|uniref:hypothetical protein n=1 Tax=unclassified Sphingopyxis TaxID=2614943 RepID=UPI0007376D43|nr:MULTISPECIES: hypothetical protein [unclassified Sphingopyxis]KTE42935.1 hypothetical protein ATE62_04265 [Sphingopyxis sp. HIX]KTE85239.1 hypothetical protein ATE72_05100 [Sphingopyxis sp. HXXIV]